MARALTAAMDKIALSSEVRSPAFKLLIYDVRSGFNSVSDIVVGADLDVTTGPRDFSEDTIEVSITEQAGDFISSGITTSEVTFSVVDLGDVFDPVNLLVDPTGNGRWLRAGNVLRLIEGDSRVDESEWVTTFTGVIIGQVGRDRNRAAGSMFLTGKAVGREVDFVHSKDVSTSFPINSTYLFMAQEIAENTLGLDAAEIEFAGFGVDITTQLTTQFIDQPGLVGIAQLMFSDGAMPRFNGFGKLTASNGLVTQTPSRVYETLNQIVDLLLPFTDDKPVNSVCVIGLEGFQSRIDSERQSLGELSVTTGWFTQNERIAHYFSEDQTQMADNIEIRVLRSVAGGLVPFAKKETILTIPPPLPALEGAIGVRVLISTGFAPYLIVMLMIGYVIVSWIPDLILGFIVGTTIPIGRAIQALFLISIQLIIASIGRGQYEFLGDPFEYVFKEIRACAETTGLNSETRISAEISNHLVKLQSTADAIAREMLFRQQARGNPRDIAIMADLALVPDDVFEIPGGPSGRRFLISSITRGYSERDGTAGAVQGMSCFEVTEGVVP